MPDKGKVMSQAYYEKQRKLYELIRKSFICNLITLQSNIVHRNSSPIDEDYLFNIYKKENELKKVLDLSKELDERYNQFISEIETLGIK